MSDQDLFTLFVVTSEEKHGSYYYEFPLFVFLTENEANSFVKEKEMNKEYDFYVKEVTAAGNLLSVLQKGTS